MTKPNRIKFKYLCLFLITACIFMQAVFLSVPAQAGTGYASTPAGPPPVATSLAWKTWFNRLLNFRLTETPLARGTTYYFSQRGDNAVGDGIHNGYPFGTLTNCSWDSGTKVLTKTGAFAAYVWQIGDTIYINGGTGIVAGSYYIASRSSNDAIVLESSIGATAADIGVSGGWWKTIAKAQTVLDAAGSTADIALLFKNGDLWKETVSTTYPITSGGATTTIQLTAGGSLYGETYPSCVPVTANVSLTGGTTETRTVTSYSPVTGILVISGTNGTTHTNITFTAPVGLNINAKSGVTVGAFGRSLNGRKPEFTCWNTPFNVTTAAKLTNVGAQTAVTWASGGSTITKTGAFAAYSWVAGDTITITGGTAVTPGVYTIASKTNSDTIVLSSSIGTSASDVTFSSAGRPYVWTYTLAETNTVAWFREDHEVGNIYRQMTSITQVEATKGSWWQDSTTNILYIHPLGDQALKTTGGSFSSAGHAYQTCYANAVTGIWILNADGTRISGLRIDGYGLTGASVNNQAASPACIKGDISGTQCALVSDCEIYFSFRHAIAILGSSSGGIITYYRVQFGWGTFAGDNVTYALYGGQETIHYECLCVGSSLPIGLQPNSTGGSGSPVISHSTYLQITSGNWSGTTVTIGGVLANVPLPQLTAGRTVNLQGGTPQTLTISSYNSGTGLLTFTGSMNGTTHTYINPALYQCNLFVAYGCTIKKGPFQPSQMFTSPANAVQWTTGNLINARCFIVNCRFEARNLNDDDKNYQYYPLSSATVNTTSATLTTAQSGTLAPIANCVVQLGGGTEPPENVLVLSYVAGTGVITLHAGSPIQGTARTWVRIPITSSSLGTVSLASNLPHGDACGDANGVNLYDCVTMNCYMEYRWLFAPNPGGGTFLNVGKAQGGFLINCILLVDYTDGTSGIGGQTAEALISASGVNAQLHNCRVEFRVPPRMSIGMELAALGTNTSGTPSNIVMKNCIISADLNTNGVQDGYAGTGSVMGPGCNNDAAKMVNNAYVNAAIANGVGGYKNDPYFVEMNGAMPLFFHPTGDSPLLSPNNQLIDGNRLEYDFDFYPRTVNGIGPYDPLPDPTSKSGRGRELSLVPLRKNNFALVSNYISYKSTSEKSPFQPSDTYRGGTK